MIRSMNGAPMFFGNKYEIWKVRMKEYIGSVGCGVWLFVGDGYNPPNKVKLATQKEAKKNNSMAIEAILDGLSYSIKGKVGQCVLAKELWNKLDDLYSFE